MGIFVFEVLFQFKVYQCIILIDVVVNIGEVIGIIYWLLVLEVEVQIEEDFLVFLYGLKWNQALFYVCKIFGDDYLEEVEVYFISVEDICFNVGMFDEAKVGVDWVVVLLKERL